MPSASAAPRAPAAAHAAASGTPELRRAAEEFEGVFLSQVLGDLNVSFTTPSVGGSGGGKAPSPRCCATSTARS